jgi:quercetin dioxygenase-like cupin family protein
MLITKRYYLRMEPETLIHKAKELSIGLLYYDEASNSEIIRAVFEKLGTTGDEKIQHEGNEWGMVLRERLKVECGNKKYVLNEGDNICFRSDVPHRVVNIVGGRTIAIWFNSPPLWFIKSLISHHFRYRAGIDGFIMLTCCFIQSNS